MRIFCVHVGISCKYLQRVRNGSRWFSAASVTPDKTQLAAYGHKVYSWIIPVYGCLQNGFISQLLTRQNRDKTALASFPHVEMTVTVGCWSSTVFLLFFRGSADKSDVSLKEGSRQHVLMNQPARQEDRREQRNGTDLKQCLGVISDRRTRRLRWE